MNYPRGVFLALIAVTVAGVSEADVQRMQPGQAGDFGAGAYIGSPTGLTGKYWLSDSRALDGALAWKEGDENRFEIAVDHLWHYAFITNPSIDGRLPFYFGLGLRVLAGDDSEAGLRLPLGVSFLCKDVPVEFFAEIAPVVRFAPDTGAGIDGGVGVRYYFKPGK